MSTARLLELMMEQVDDHSAILLDADGFVVDWLMGSKRIFGYEREEMVGRTIDCLFTPGDRDSKVPRGELEIAERQGWAADDRWMLRKDGLRFWASGFVHSLREQDGTLAGFSKVLRDRTDVRGQIEALRNRAGALAAEERRYALVIAKLAHEIRNPLGVLGNAVGLLKSVPGGEGTVGYASSLVERQTQYLSKLVEDVLEFARLREGKAVLRASRIDLEVLLADALEVTSAKLREKRQHVERLIRPAPIFFEGDAGRLKQVLVNLLDNASKFSDPGATIWVKCLVEGDEVVVRVRDPGCGISADMLPRVFELFTQASRDSDEGSKGLGLGLSLVKEYVELHGGSVQVRSEGVNLGSELTVRLPLTQRTAPDSG